MEAELDALVGWHDGFRPHEALGGAIPNEVYRRVRPLGTDLDSKHEPGT